MENEFIPYEQALALKELGFDESCFGSYDPFGSKQLSYNGIYIYGNCIAAPTFSQAFRFFREKYGMYSHIKTSGKISVLEFTWVSNGKYGFFSKDGFKTYEEAELACLIKLIEIIKTK